MVLSHMPARQAAALVQGRLDIAAGRYEDARRQFSKALAMKPLTGVVASATWGLIQIELRTGNPQAALVLARRAVNVSSTLQAGYPYSMGTGHSHLLLGRALQALGENKAAQQAFETSVLHLSNTVDAVHPLLISARKLAAQNL